MDVKSEAVELNKDETNRQPYQTPQLFVYGSIHEITKNLGPNGALDNAGGAGGPPKTQ